MWVLRKSSAPRVHLWRRISLSATIILVALFAYLGPLSHTASALGDAEWDGTTLTADGHTFSPVTAPPDRSGTKAEYQWVDQATQPDQAYVLYFKDSPSADKTATLVIYNDGSNYTKPDPDQTVNVKTVSAPSSSSTSNSSSSSSDTSNSCANGGGIGWIICPVSDWISNGVDTLYGYLSEFLLQVTPITKSNNGIYQIWDMTRTLANVCFILIFMVIIYSQLTSMGYSNYNIKDMIPRLIIAAIAVNISF